MKSIIVLLLILLQSCGWIIRPSKPDPPPAPKPTCAGIKCVEVTPAPKSAASMPLEDGDFPIQLKNGTAMVGMAGSHLEIGGTLVDGKCSICVKAGLKSTVKMDGFESVTTAYCGPYGQEYDADGKVVPQKPRTPCNTATRRGTCSNGHYVIATSPSW